MSRERLNRRITAELHLLAAQGLIDPAQLATLTARYPSGRWDVRALVRVFTIIGMLAMVAGLLQIAPTFVDVERLMDGGLALLCGVSLWVGLRVRARRPATGAALHLGTGLLLQAFTLSFADHHRTGSDNWPALVGLDALLLMALAYILRNRLVLTHACVTLFVWFGGATGYSSDWGAYWLRMTYPLRFALAGVCAVGIGYGHFRFLRGPLQAFSRVWAHFGLLVLNLALWFCALFGSFEERPHWDGNETERLLFSLLWGLVGAVSLLVGSQRGLRVLRGHGLVFLIINFYTFYFQFVIWRSPEAWFLHLLLAGGGLVGLGVWLDGRRKRARVPAPAPQDPPFPSP